MGPFLPGGPGNPFSPGSPGKPGGPGGPGNPIGPKEKIRKRAQNGLYSDYNWISVCRVILQEQAGRSWWEGGTLTHSGGLRRSTSAKEPQWSMRRASKLNLHRKAKPHILNFLWGQQRIRTGWEGKSST